MLAQGACGLRPSSVHVQVRVPPPHARLPTARLARAVTSTRVQRQPQHRSARAQASPSTGGGGTTAEGKMLLQKLLAQSKSGEEVLQLCSEHVATFDHIHAATAVNRLGLLTSTAAVRRSLLADPRAAALMAALQSGATKLNAQGVANVLWGFGRLAPEYAPPAALLAALEKAASRPDLWKDAYPQALANAAWGYARLGPNTAKSGPLDVLAAATMARASDFKLSELAQLLHAFGSTGRVPAVPGFADGLWAACDAKMEQFKPQELAIVMWSFARMSCSPGEKALQRAASILASHTDDLDMQAASNGLWALAVLWAEPDRAVLARLVGRAQLLLPSSASPQAICNVLWAVAKLRFDPGPVFVADTVARALALADALGPADMLQLCYSLVELRYAAGPRSLDALAAAVDKQLQAFSDMQLATVLTALARMGFDPPQDFATRLWHHTYSIPKAGRPALLAALAQLGLKAPPVVKPSSA